MCGFGGSVGEDVSLLRSLFLEGDFPSLLSRESRVRSGESAQGSPEAFRPRGGFIGPGRGVDKGGGVLMQLSGVTGVKFPAICNLPTPPGLRS